MTPSNGPARRRARRSPFAGIPDGMCPFDNYDGTYTALVNHEIPNSRVDRARARDTGGTGLGLAIVRHAVSNHGGDVSVESMEGEGSTFTLRFPVS